MVTTPSLAALAQPTGDSALGAPQVRGLRGAWVSTSNSYSERQCRPQASFWMAGMQPMNVRQPQRPRASDVGTSKRDSLNGQRLRVGVDARMLC
jgi:hypothetical protein